MLLNDSITDYYWCVGDSFYHTNTNTLEHRYTIRNLFKIYLAVKTEKGCIDTAFKTVQINPLPKYKYYFDGPTTFYEGNNLTVSVEGNFNTIYWSTKDTNNTITISNSGSFFFIITDTNNCSVKEKFEVTVLPRLEIIIPTIITPNGDGINDKFIIKNRECCDDFKIWIYNRNGNEVYSSINYNNDWDGKYNGNILPEGPYYYIIECCKNKTYKGSVNILK